MTDIVVSVKPLASRGIPDSSLPSNSPSRFFSRISYVLIYLAEKAPHHLPPSIMFSVPADEEPDSVSSSSTELR